MTDSHCHVRGKGSRHFICDPADCTPAETDVVFYGYHPWIFSGMSGNGSLPDMIDRLGARLAANPCAGVGEIGLDRLRNREIPDSMRRAFALQLRLAAELHRPVVIHGAKCWGETVKACKEFSGAIPAFLFHGFSRSWGLLDEIKSIGGYISAGPALLNLHAANYRKAIAAAPLDMLLAESDATAVNSAAAPLVADVVRAIANVKNTGYEEVSASLEANADDFIRPLNRPRGGLCLP